MGLLDKLWDDSLAGPCPDSGLGKLRKITITNSSVAPASTPVAEEALGRLRKCRASAECQRSNDEARQVTQSITIVKPPGYLRSLFLDIPSSPAGSSPPISPSSLTPRERENPWRSNKHEKGSLQCLGRMRVNYLVGTAHSLFSICGVDVNRPCIYNDN